jgi:hypothetical protein
MTHFIIVGLNSNVFVALKTMNFENIYVFKKKIQLWMHNIHDVDQGVLIKKNILA